jgi:hypothetical protein
MQSSKKSNFSAQGTIEYLIAISVVVTISLAVVGVVTGVVSAPGEESSTTSSQLAAMTYNNLAITTTTTNPQGNYLIRLLNNIPETITITKININGTPAQYTIQLPQASAQNFTVTTTDTCTLGKNKKVKVTIDYTGASGLEHTIEFPDALNFPCENYTPKENPAPTTQTTLNLTGTLYFGNINIGSIGRIPFVVTNTGATDANITSLTLPTGFSSDWNQGTIPANGNKIITILFAPDTNRSFTGTIIVNSNAMGTNTIDCNGIGVNAPTNLVINGGFEQDFTNWITASSGQWYVNTSDKHSGSKSVNTGWNCPSFSTLEQTMTIPSTPGQPTYLWLWYKNGGTQSVKILKASDRSTLQTVTLPSAGVWTEAIADISANQGQTVILRTEMTNCGNLDDIQILTGPVPRISLSADANLIFGNTDIGRTTSLDMNITNPGSGTLTINSITVPTGFSTDWNQGLIPAGQTQKIKVIFTPTQYQKYSGTIIVNSNAMMGTNTIDANAYGTYQNTLFYNPSFELDFAGWTYSGNRFDIGTTDKHTGTKAPYGYWNCPNNISLEQKIAIPQDTNISKLNFWYKNGSMTMKILRASDRSTLLSMGVASASNWTEALYDLNQFIGQTVIARLETTSCVTIDDIQVLLGPIPKILLGSSILYGNTPIGRTNTQTFSITNTESGALTINSIVLPGGFVSDWNQGIISGNQTQNITITFSPLAAQKYTGNIVVNSTSMQGNAQVDQADINAWGTNANTLFYNPGFEEDFLGWTYSGNRFDIGTSDKHSGAKAPYGNWNCPNNISLEQKITIPSNAVQPRLDFWYKNGSMTIKILRASDRNVLQTGSAANVGVWTESITDLNAYIGQTIIPRLETTSCLLVDDVQVTFS